MSQERNGKNSRDLQLLCALAAPVIHAASGCTWLAAGVTGAVVLFSGWCVHLYASEPGKLLRMIHGIWICLLLGEVLRWSGSCWPGHSKGEAAPLILLGLAVWTVWRGKRQAQKLCTVLAWPVVLLLGVVLLSGVKDIAIENLKPEIGMNSANLISLLLPFFAHEEQEGGFQTKVKGLAVLIGVWAAVVTSGMLSYHAAYKMSAPFYEVSRSIQVLGAVERYESFAAIAMTLGYFGTMVTLLHRTAKGGMLLAYGAAIAVSYLLDVSLDSRALASSGIIIWVMLPSVNSLRKKLKKDEKSA